jgi:hypothetical protein
MTPSEREKIELFLAYLTLKGRREVQREWMQGQGPWYSILVRNTYGVEGIRNFGRNLRKKLGDS